MPKKVLVEITIDEGRWDPTWDGDDHEASVINSVQSFIENAPEWPPYFASANALPQKANLYKIVFIGVEQEYAHIVVGGASREDREESQKNVPKHPVRCIYQTLIFENSGEIAIEAVKAMAKEAGIVIEDFTKVSLIASTQAIGVFMRERL